MSWSDRRYLLGGLVLAGLLALGACGFEPVYKPGGDLQQKLADVYVDPLDSRVGQATRDAILNAIAAPDRNPDAKYRLTLIVEETRENVGIQSDETASRINVGLNTVWKLARVDVEGTLLGSGSVRRVVPLNVVDDDFASLIATRDAEKLVGRLTGEAVRQRVLLLLRRD
ncbi:hypothetical protein [Minwuia sp.]|uniref:hypothetical protein n=1 Tax=Minwuia sp. TaxID=2493630 RepID=UPI003A932FD2